MADFSVIIQSPEIRALVQERLLERAFHDALFPALMFRGEAAPVPWPCNAGDSQLFTGSGLIAPNAAPLAPNTDPIPQSYSTEQWQATAQLYAGTIDTNMPTNMVAIVDLFYRNTLQLGMGAAQSMNRAVRDRMYNAAESGWTVVDGAFTSTATIRVKRLNGFTRARRPTVSGASVVRFDFVSSSNPLPVTFVDSGSPVTTSNVIGFTADTAGDETGPGTVTLDNAVTSVANRSYFYSYDATDIVRAGGGLQVDDISPGDTIKLATIRQAVTSFWFNNVPAHSDSRFHAHADPQSLSELYDDPEMQRLNTSLPDYVIYRQFAVGELLNVVFLRNTECPIKSTVNPGDGVTFSQTDPFAPELYSTGAVTGTAIHRVLVTARDGIMEYYNDQSALITEAGINGKIGQPTLNNNGIEIAADRIQLIFKAPTNRLQDLVSTSWRFIGDWPARTDAATGDAARYKRFVTIAHA